MQDNFPYPEFITPVMKLWLKQYKAGDMHRITKIGLFDWRFSSTNIILKSQGEDLI